MGLLQVLDALGVSKYLKKDGLGTSSKPFKDVIERYHGINSTLITSEALTLNEYKQVVGKDDVLFDEELGAGGSAATVDAVNGGVELAVTASGEYAIRQTKNIHTYIAGNPQQIEMTTKDITPVAGTVKRMGYYDSSTTSPFTAELDGLCLETDGSTEYFKVYKNGATIFSAARSGWDDPLNGSGESGITFAAANFQALIIEFLYLGGTCARFGFIINDMVVWCHTFSNSNVNSATMIKTPNKPLRWEIRSSGGASTFHHICGKVGMLGKPISKGVTRHHNNGSTYINANVVGTKYALLGVKPNSRAINLQVLDITGMPITADGFLLELVLNPTVAGTFTYSAVTDAHYDLAVGAADGSNTITNGTSLGGGYVSSSGDISIELDNTLGIGCLIDGTFDNIVLCATPMSANLDVVGGFSVSVKA